MEKVGNIKTGLVFEKRSSLKEMFLKINGFSINDDFLFLDNKKGNN